MSESPEIALAQPDVIEAMARGFIELKGTRIHYNLNQRRSYDWSDPEEWVPPVRE